jgi:hypothetical protein
MNVPGVFSLIGALVSGLVLSALTSSRKIAEKVKANSIHTRCHERVKNDVFSMCIRVHLY